MSRVIGLDYGKKRTGVAVTDDLQLIATPLKTVESYRIIAFLKDYIAAESVETIVVGWPLQLDGNEGPATRLVAQFMRLLKRHFAEIPVVHYDERFTSVIAQKSLFASGLKKKKRQEKARLDARSASLILGSFLEKKRWKARQVALG